MCTSHTGRTSRIGVRTSLDWVCHMDVKFASQRATCAACLPQSLLLPHTPRGVIPALAPRTCPSYNQGGHSNLLGQNSPTVHPTLFRVPVSDTRLPHTACSGYGRSATLATFSFVPRAAVTCSVQHGGTQRAFTATGEHAAQWAVAHAQSRMTPFQFEHTTSPSFASHRFRVAGVHPPEHPHAAVGADSVSALRRFTCDMSLSNKVVPFAPAEDGRPWPRITTTGCDIGPARRSSDADAARDRLKALAQHYRRQASSLRQELRVRRDALAHVGAW